LPTPLSDLHAELGIPASYGADRRLAAFDEAEESALVEIARSPEGRAIRLVPDAADAWQRLRDAATLDAIELIPISGFRSVARQAEIIRAKRGAGLPLNEILSSIAAPGFSEHHTGRAIDIGSLEHIELDEDFAGTAAFRWLERNAAGFGFRLSFPRDNPHGIVYEPWHWCWHPRG
jgi:D-alanyl-D-alanine carboxypeptidase